MVCKTVFLLAISRYLGSVMEKKKIEKTGQCKGFWFWNKLQNGTNYVYEPTDFLQVWLDILLTVFAKRKSNFPSSWLCFMGIFLWRLNFLRRRINLFTKSVSLTLIFFILNLCVHSLYVHATLNLLNIWVL